MTAVLIMSATTVAHLIQTRLHNRNRVRENASTIWTARNASHRSTFTLAHRRSLRRSHLKRKINPGLARHRPNTRLSGLSHRRSHLKRNTNPGQARRRPTCRLTIQLHRPNIRLHQNFARITALINARTMPLAWQPWGSDVIPSP